jgi:hypothetical protein
MMRERAGPRFFVDFFFAAFFLPAFLFFIAMSRLRWSQVGFIITRGRVADA